MELSRRTKGHSYQVELASYWVVRDFLAAYAQEKNRKVTVLFDPALFVPQGGADYRIVEFFSGSPDWNLNAEVVVIGLRHTLKRPEVPKDSPGHTAYLKECGLYEKNVTAAATGMVPARRYRRCLELPNGGEILVAAGRR